MEGIKDWVSIVKLIPEFDGSYPFTEWLAEVKSLLGENFPDKTAVGLLNYIAREKFKGKAADVLGGEKSTARITWTEAHEALTEFFFF